MQALVIGCGYVGSALAIELARRGHNVTGARRSVGRDANLENAGVRLLSADIANAGDLRKLGTDYHWVVNCAAPSAGGVEDYKRVYLEGMRNVVTHFRHSLVRCFVYTSSSGVYGQNDGSEVIETSATEPESETGKILLDAEAVLLEASRQAGFPGIVLRASGIYGPGRTYWLKMFLSGEPGIEAGNRYMNMIHRDDLVGAIIAALEKGRAGEIYNATDNEPVMQRDLFAWLSEKTGRPMPPLQPASGGEPRRRASTSKRISNRKLREELKYVFRHPTFREGYGAELPG